MPAWLGVSIVGAGVVLFWALSLRLVAVLFRAGPRSADSEEPDPDLLRSTTGATIGDLPTGDRAEQRSGVREDRPHPGDAPAFRRPGGVGT